MDTQPVNVKSDRKTAVSNAAHCPPLPQERRRELMRLERQMIPVLNSIRAELGKRPVIVPKE